ncbi:penicillin acylase family protein [Nocardioides perillae]|uniref:Penicillin amidase n=1 Tax=Nocardioides perillae TaxID=1119534 RepID=A0A7Y9RUQ6_9ACTN|nr:penicillin acylase family protein [Nocardioides perillae]NYG56992.1 penicillin amidase [Nocardioides perillae]
MDDRTPAPPAEPRLRDAVPRVRDWPRPARWALGTAVVLVLLLVAGVATAATLVRRPLPQTEGRLELAGLDAEVQVLRDEHGIPQVYADTAHDLFFAQGFVQAQDRFWEMDVRRHATAGRLAELFGEAALESDKTVRTMGWRRVAQRELALVEPATRAALTAYADGVNAYLDGRGSTDVAVEYTLLRATGLDHTIEPWEPVDSLAWLKAMAWDLRGNMAEEVERVTAAVRVGRARAEQLFPAYPYDEHEPIVDGGAVVGGTFDADAEAVGATTASGVAGGSARPAPGWTAAQARALTSAGEALGAVPPLLGHGDGLGSNSWVVAGEHTASGLPLLANDPHLGVSLPGVWTQVGLHCRTVDEECPYEVSGFSFAGVPGVVIGHNADVAWGFTNLGPDVTDLFLERVRGDRYQHGRRLRPLETRTEVVEVRDAPDFELVVRETHHGPLLSDVSRELSSVGANAPTPDALGDPARGNGYAVALAWTALRPSPTADALLALNQAEDWADFRAAAADFAVPAQNLVYADREGHVGYQAPGRVPVRLPGNDGRWPAEGWRLTDDWSARPVPFEALPSELDPDDGLVVTANQAVVGPDYPYLLTRDWDLGYRAQRIRDRLESDVAVGERLGVDDAVALQLDDRHPFATTLLPHLLRQDLPRGFFSDGQRLLRDWDLAQSADSAGAAYFNAVWSHLLRLTFHDELPAQVHPDGGDRWFGVVDALLDDPLDPWWDDVGTPGLETRDDVVRQAMRDARDELTRLLGRDAEEWEWGRLHRLDLQSPTIGQSGSALAERLLNRDGWEVSGGSSTVDATSWDAAEGYGVTAAPSMRMVVDLADLDDSRWISLTGVSGHPASEHYVDQTERWVDGRTLPWPFGEAAVRDATRDVLVLEPAEEPLG